MDGVEEEEEEEEATLWLEADLPKPLYPADFHLPPKLLLVTPTSPPPSPVSLCLVMVSVLNY